jgi:iron uptake system component EfeO
MVSVKRRTVTALALAGVLALVLAACGGGDGNKIGVTEKDFSISLDKSSAKTGEVTFSVKNDGPSTHEFVVFKTDLAADQLPLTKDDNGIDIVDEAGAGVTAVDEIEDIASGSTQELKVTLQAGNYVAICNLPAHYQQGMRASFTVAA